jgi:AAA+ ATPase superfamily predicted ATPase
MITLFEGKRNSGKTYLSKEFSKISNTPLFKYDFVNWFKDLGLDDKSKTTHYFAIGKESMLLQLNREGFLKDLILDRGILTVLTWAILSNRVSKEEVYKQLEMVKSKGLLGGIRIFFVVGNNPNPETRNKDLWDETEKNNFEEEIMESLIRRITEGNSGIEVITIENDFTSKTIETLKLLV